MRTGSSTSLIKSLVVVIFITGYAWGSATRQTASDARLEEAKKEARQVATELADQVRTLLFKELEKGGYEDAVRVCSEAAQENLPADHETQALLHTVVSEAERLEQLVGDLLAFARPPVPQITRFDLNRLIKEVTGMMAQSIDRSGIKIDQITGPDELIVRSDENGLRQVLLNVVLNALDATPDGGSF